MLYAIPAVLGAAVGAVAHVAGSSSALFRLIGAVVRLVLRLVGFDPCGRWGDQDEREGSAAAREALLKAVLRRV